MPVPPEKRTKRSLDNTRRIKPKHLTNYLTIQELSGEIGKDPSWIRRLEREGRLPEPGRVRRGKVAYRLYSPAHVEEVKHIFSTHKRGRPRKDERN